MMDFHNIQGVELGLLIGCVPTIAMIIASVALTNINVSKYLEASFQNFAAGLILAAVASELFPLMLIGVNEQDTWLGVTVGFALGLTVLNGLETLIETLVEYYEKGSHSDFLHFKGGSTKSSNNNDTPVKQLSVKSRHNSIANTSGRSANTAMNQIVSKFKNSSDHLSDLDRPAPTDDEIEEFTGGYQKSYAPAMDEEWEEEPVHQASLAIAQPSHRNHLHSHVQEIINMIKEMEEKCARLVDSPSSYNNIASPLHCSVFVAESPEERNKNNITYTNTSKNSSGSSNNNKKIRKDESMKLPLLTDKQLMEIQNYGGSQTSSSSHSIGISPVHSHMYAAIANYINSNNNDTSTTTVETEQTPLNSYSNTLITTNNTANTTAGKLSSSGSSEGNSPPSSTDYSRTSNGHRNTNANHNHTTTNSSQQQQSQQTSSSASAALSADSLAHQQSQPLELPQALTQREAEDLAEEIDENTHQLQYKLDHCRRLLQGSETEMESGHKTTWLTEDKKQAMKKRLQLLKLTGEHLIEHLQEEYITVDTLKEMFEHMTDMDRVISSFHDSIENVVNKWIRRKRDLVVPELGDTVPISLFVPVTLDCFTDGFLIGVSCALSPSAGLVLGFANCLEMSFLGMAYSLRLKKCTGSSWAVRQMALLFPPILMFLAAGFGAFAAHQAKETPAVFIGFVAFGTVALLSLVCGELLIEAKEAQGEEEVWYVSLSLYAAVYVVLMLYPILE